MKTHHTTQDLPVAKQPRKRYSTEFKRQILEACNQPNISVAQVAREYGLNANLIHNWRQAFKRSSDVALSPAFIPLPMKADPNTSANLFIELPSPRGKIGMHWPMEAMADLTPFLKAMQQ